MAYVDFTVREIRKIRLLLEALRMRLTGGGGEGNASAIPPNAYAQIKERLKQEAKFDLDYFLALTEGEEEGYIRQLPAFDSENMDRLAGLLYSLALSDALLRQRLLLKSLYLYRLNDRLMRTFSFERYRRILEITGLLEG